MLKTRNLFILVCLCFTHSFVYGQISVKWGDQGNGIYCNPVLPADYSDPDAIRVGNDYYAISSTMQFSPGMIVLQSKDLVNWKIIGHVVNDLTCISPELNWDRMNCYGKGIWAGSIRYYKNKFRVYFGTPDNGFFMSSATNPAGPWEPLHQFWKVSGWDDCCSFCDDDGQLYFIATNFMPDPVNKKKYNIHLFKMTPDGEGLMMESDTIIHQSKGSEANKLYKINALYYHFFSEVNNEGRVCMMERSKNIYGPWEIKQLNHVNAKKDREPNQGGLLETAPNEWSFFTHHGTGDWEGRMASLLPVKWIDGWPIIGEVGEDKTGRMVWSAPRPVTKKNKFFIQTSDEFKSTSLNVQWEWNYQPRADMWSLTDRKGYLRLYAFRPVNNGNNQKIILRAGNTITQRSMRTKICEVTVKIDIRNMADDEYAGLSHFSTTGYSMFGVKQEKGKRFLFYDCDGNDSTGVKIKEKTVWLRSSWNYKGINSYYFSVNGQFYKPFGGTSRLTWGSYRGDRIGIYNFNTKEDKGYVDIDRFRYDYSKD